MLTNVCIANSNERKSWNLYANFSFQKNAGATLSGFLKITALCFLIGVVANLLFINPLQAQRFVHPGIPFTRYDLDLLKENIKREPWLSAYNAFKSNGRSQLSYGMQGPFATVTRAPNLNNAQWKSDMEAIHNLTFMWVFTGDSAYARKATNMLDAWAVVNTVWGGNESMLDIGDFVEYWATAADILKSTFPGWTAANSEHVKSYFINVLYPTSWVPYQLRDANKGALQLKIALAAAAFCDDTTRFNLAIDTYRKDAGAGLRNSLTNGEVGDAGRDDHWRVQAAALVWGAEVAWKQGFDMYAELDNRVLAIGELYHQYAFEGATMKFIPMGGYASFWTGWGIPTGARRGDYTNTLKAAYALRKGIATPFTDMMREALGGAGGNFLYLKSADTSTATPLPPVFYPAEHVQPVGHLTNTDIGNPGMAGSASFNNSIWTLKGAGTSLSNAVSYNFKKMSGDAGLVIRVTGMSLNTGGSGVMIRQSLAPGAPYWAAQLGAGGGVGPHYQAKLPWWLKIERVSNRIFTYHSPDGVNWTGSGVSYSAANFPEELYYGFYTLSNNNSALNTATFSDVGFSQGAPVGSPEISSATSASVKTGTPFSYGIKATGTPTTYSVSGLPQSLSLDAASGIISGTPTILGQSEITLGATNSSGTGTATLILNVINSEAPAAPVATASVVNSTQVRLTWNAPANAISYSLKRSLTAGGPYTIIETGITDTSFTDVTPIPEVNNYYVVTALSGEQESSNSNEVFASVPPAIPGCPEVTNGNGQIGLTWDTAFGATSYRIKRGMVSGGSYTNIAIVTTNSYIDMAVTNGTPYYYVVSALGDTKESANSPEAFAVPGSNSLSWSAEPDTTNLNHPGNWLENRVPENPAILSFNTSTDSVLTNDLPGLEVSRIQFEPDASAFTISGDSLALNNDLVNNSGQWQRINTPLVLNKALSIAANTSGITLAGRISGAGSLRKTGSGVLDLFGNNMYYGGTIITGSIGGWPPSNGIAATGHGTGTPSNPDSGPLGTGKVIFNGGGLWSVNGDVTLYNDIEVPAGQVGWLFDCCNAMILRGRLLGSGTIQHDGNVTAGLHLFGDNSGFTGTFVSRLRSGNSRTRFQVPESGSARAHWNLDANGNDCQSLQFSSGTIHFGGLSGRGLIRTNGGGSPVISIGALNTNTTFQGTIYNSNGSVYVEKVGTGTLRFSGNNTYWAPTTIKDGAFLVVNHPTSGTFSSPIVDSSGTFGGTGLSQASVTIGTGTTATAVLEPGDNGIGKLTTTSSLTLNSNAIFNVQLNTKAGTGDRMVAGSVVFNGSPRLTISNLDSSDMAPATSFIILEITGGAPIDGAFKDLPELGLVSVGNYSFRITYKGGTGNDVVLLDDRTLPVTFTNVENDTTLVNRPYSFVPETIKSPTHFSATSLPAGLSIDTTTGVISGTPVVSGKFTIILSAANDSTTGTDTLHLVVKSNVVEGVIVASGDGRNIVEWDPILKLGYRVKRSALAGGPYTIIASATSAKVIDSVTNGNTYHYVVAAVDSATEFPNSAEVVAMPNKGQYGYWKFDDSIGTRSVDAFGANHAALAPAATWTTGKLGGALKFSGTANAYATLPPGLVNSLDSFTVATWLRQDAKANWMRVFDFGRGTNNYMFLTLQAGTDIIRYTIKNGGGEQTVSYTYPVPLAAWIHIAITQQGNTARLYINGTLVATNTGITIKPNQLGITDQNYLGKSQFSADPLFNGALDELTIYSRPLSAAEITGLVKKAASQGTVVDGLIVASGDRRNILEWNELAKKTYQVKRSQTQGGPYATIAGSTEARFIDSAITNGTAYYYVVAATDSTKEYVHSEEVMATPNLGQHGFYQFEEGLEFRVIDAWGANHGLLASAATRSAGKAGTALKLNGTANAYATLPSGIMSSLDSFTVATWVRMDAKSNWMRVFDFGKGTTNYMFLTIQGGTANLMQYSIKNGSAAGQDLKYTYTLPLNTWIHFAITQQGNTARMYINGTLVATNTSTTIKPNQLGITEQNYLGKSQFSADAMFNGSIDQFKIFNRPLSASEIAAIMKETQTITFKGLAAKKIGNSDFNPGATATSGLPVSYSSSDTTVATIQNGLVHIVGAGTTTLTAAQAGDATYYAAGSVTRNLSVGKKGQTITFGALSQKTVGDPDFSADVLASSDLSVRLSSSDTAVATIVNGQIHIIGAGTTDITAAQEGNNVYNPAEAISQDLVVVKKDQLITFTALQEKNVGEADFDAGAIASSGLPVTLTSSNVSVATIENGLIHITGAGTTIITASQPGNASYAAADASSQTLMVKKLTQTISFASLTDKKVGDADFVLTATATSGLPVTYTSANSAVAVVVNGTVHITGAGSTTITANQAGNETFEDTQTGQPLVVTTFNLKVQHLDGDNGQKTNNSIRPYLKLVNEGTSAIPYSELTIRYWITVENFSGISTAIDYAQIGNSKMKMTYVSLDQPRNGANGYVEYGFETSAGNFAGGSNSGVIQSRLNNTNYANLSEADDHSYYANNSYAMNNKITVYRNGQLVSGAEPVAVAPVTALKAQSESKNNGGSNSISTYLKISNEGNVPVEYKDISVRYWFTSEGTSPLNYWIDYAVLGNSNLTGQFVRLSPALTNADAYFELKVNATAGNLYPLSNSGNIQYRIAKSDWSNFNQLNDYSYKPVAPFSENAKITAYYKGVLVYGTEPSINGVAMRNAGETIASENLNGTIDLYPNPVISSLNIRVSKLEANANVEVYNNLGALVYAQRMNNLTQNISMKRFTPGVYFVQVRNGAKVISKQIVKE